VNNFMRRQWRQPDSLEDLRTLEREVERQRVEIALRIMELEGARN
jgi:hypothetical protein